MAEPTTTDLAKLIETLSASISNLQGQVAALQQKRPPAGTFSGSRALVMATIMAIGHHDSRSWTSPSSTASLTR